MPHFQDGKRLRALSPLCVLLCAPAICIRLHSKTCYCCHLQGKRSTARRRRRVLICFSLAEESTSLKIDADEAEQTASPLPRVSFARVSFAQITSSGLLLTTQQNPSKPCWLSAEQIDGREQKKKCKFSCRCKVLNVLGKRDFQGRTSGSGSVTNWIC